MDPAITAVIGLLTLIITVAIPLFVKELKDTRKTFGSEVKEIQKVGSDNSKLFFDKCEEISNRIGKLTDRQTIAETKLDIFLDCQGFDIHKVNKAIKENMEELKKNDKPSVGCINTKELRKAGE